MAESLKKQAFRGIGWSAVERFSVQGINFFLQIVLARLLLPSDYGIIAMLAIFLQVAGVFVDSGFANALIQKQDCTEKDYSTVFHCNLGISICVYLSLYFIAPLVAWFYKIELITNVMRISSLVVIFNACTIVQRTKLIKQINFKSQSIVSFCSSLVSGVIGIIMAYLGFGVWALCFQSIFNSLIQIFLFYYFVRWLPSLLFSKDSFIELFGFGSKILVASIISVIYNNLYTIVIGKRFSSSDLGYYSRADHFAVFPSYNLGSIISRVSYPVLSKIQNDDNRLRIAYRKIIRYSTFIIFPLMISVSTLSRPLISVLLGENWVETASILQILCIALMWDHLSLLNLNLLYVKGKSNLVLRLEIIKKAIAISILFISIPFGVIIMCWGRVLYCLVAFYINTYYTKRLIGISFWQQMSDVIPFLLLSVLIACFVLFIITLFPLQYGLQLTFGICVGFFLYITLSILFFKEIKDRLLLSKKK